MTTKTRRLLAFLGPTLAGVTYGIDSASYSGAREFIVQAVVGAAVGATLVAFVPEDRR